MNKTTEECVERYRNVLSALPDSAYEDFVDFTGSDPDHAISNLRNCRWILCEDDDGDAEGWIREARRHVDKHGRPNELVFEPPLGRPVPVGISTTRH